jgi:hypothetical protein
VVPSNVLKVLFCSLNGKLLKSLYKARFNIILTWLEFESEKADLGEFRNMRELSLSKIK